MFEIFPSISMMLCLSLAGFLNYGCAGISENPDLKNIAEETSYATQVFNAPYHQVFKAVEKALTCKEYSIKMCDEKEDDIGDWQDFPVSSFNLDLIDSDSYDMFFYNISQNLRDPQSSGS